MVNIRRASSEDCKLLWEWTNDPEVRSASFSSQYISWNEHVAWFTGKMSDPKCHLYLIMSDDSEAIGQIRFELERHDLAVVSISMAKDKRSRGYGTQALELALKQFTNLTDIKQVIAYVKPDNSRSIRTFEKAGFAKAVERNVKGQPALELLWKRK
jgi:UDP-2,4-diacetamido-2,4,6-trideoxy-beta-L-altropyranose hydrolase